MNHFITLKETAKTLNSFHANVGNVHPSQYSDILKLLYSMQFMIESLIKLFGGAK